MKKFMKILKILTILGFFLFFQQIASAAGDCNAPAGCHCLEVQLPGITNKWVCGPAAYLSGIYKLAVGIAVALAAIMIVYGGILWSTSGDSPSRKTEAKKHITQAIFGLVLLLASYLILRTVNPDLTNLGKWENLPAQQVPPAAGIASNSEECQAKRSASASCVAKNCNKLGTSTAENCNCLVNCCNQAGISPNCGNCQAPGCF